MKHKSLLSILAILISFSAHSGPARRGPVYLSQPDGTVIAARMRGDEFMKIITTEAGNAIIQDGDGWWCHARYDESGRKISTGYRVGTETPAEIVSMGRMIPYEKLAEKAGRKRMLAGTDEEPVISRILRQVGPDSKSDGAGPVTKHGLVILAQFRDQEFTYSREDFVRMLTQEGYSLNGATGSAKEYFDDQFGGAIEFSFDVSPIVTLPANMKFYGGNGDDDNDSNPQQMVIDACEEADKDVDFSLYDDDGDGTVDNVFIFFAGGDEAEGAGSDRIWSHSWYIFSGAGRKLVLDGKTIDRYACTSELTRIYISPSNHQDALAGIGTFCHEYFHTFGIPDMYDTDYEESGGQAAGLWGSTSLMDSGNQNNYGNTPPYLNAVEREVLGISEPVTIRTNGSYSLEPIHLNGKYYRLDTDHEDEYYIIECRSKEGWDKHCGGSGMLVYHIDKSRRNAGYSDAYGTGATAFDRWGNYNEVNSRPDHQCADLIEADARQDGFGAGETEAFHASLDNVSGIFFPNAAANSLTPENRRELTFWSGNTGIFSITNIRKDGNGISFNVLGFSETELPPSVSSVQKEEFTDAAIILFESDRIFEGEAVAEWGKSGSDTETVRIKPYEPGKYSLTLENLEPGNKTYTVRIHFELGGIAGEARSVSFMTSKSPAVPWPFIFMSRVATNPDGTLPAGSKLPLRLYNAGDAAEITWTFDGEEISVGDDGYFTVGKSGILKARMVREDGSEELIMKEIIIGEAKK